MDVRDNINNDALQLSAAFIKAELGDINDLPYELANTVVNVYYRFFNMVSAYLNKENALKILSIKLLKEELLQQDKNVIPYEELANALVAVQTLPDFIVELRKVNKDKNPIEYRKTLEFLLDMFKYNIKDTKNKLLLRRIFERPFKSEIKEIPALIDLIK
ncbi:MAG: hypothetical protein L3V56_02400 [Candidatus Magnetoovum sp. WYHC-5]|nr:hypothetical protein [Candidatus Magnetoovum sp. WYHC-5]